MKFNLEAPEQEQVLPEGAGGEAEDEDEASERSAWSPERATAEELVAALMQEWAAPMCEAQSWSLLPACYDARQMLGSRR